MLFFDDVGREASLAPIFFIEQLHTRLRAKIQHGWGIPFCELEQSAADPPLLVFRKDKQFGDGSKIISVRKNPQAAHKRPVIVGGYVYGF